MADDCPRLGKMFGGCRFEARYSHPEITTPIPEGLNRYIDRCLTMDDNDIAAIETFRPRVYEGDVCVRCGKFALRALADRKPIGKGSEEVQRKEGDGTSATNSTSSDGLRKTTEPE